MTPAHRLLVALNSQVCETTLREALSGLAAIVALVGGMTGFLAFCANV